MRIGEPAFNAERTLALARRASDDHAALIAFPELGMSGYSIDDLLHQGALLDGVEAAIGRIAAESAGAGADHRRRCAAAVRARPVQLRGRDPPRPGPRGGAQELPARVPGVLREAPVPSRARRRRRPDPPARLGGPVRGRSPVPRPRPAAFVLHVEMCEDLWVPIPPSTFGALAGATVLANLSASNITIGKAEYRRTLCSAQSARDDRRATCTPRPGWASRPPTWPGTGRPSSSRTATCWPRRSASRPTSS